MAGTVPWYGRPRSPWRVLVSLGLNLGGLVVALAVAFVPLMLLQGVQLGATAISVVVGLPLLLGIGVYLRGGRWQFLDEVHWQIFRPWRIRLQIAFWLAAGVAFPISLALPETFGYPSFLILWLGGWSAIFVVENRRHNNRNSWLIYITNHKGALGICLLLGIMSIAVYDFMTGYDGDSEMLGLAAIVLGLVLWGSWSFSKQLAVVSMLRRAAKRQGPAAERRLDKLVSQRQRGIITTSELQAKWLENQNE